jgi:hypothetical protein
MFDYIWKIVTLLSIEDLHTYFKKISLNNIVSGKNFKLVLQRK